MRRFTLLLLAALGCGGCYWPGHRAECGWRFEVYKPPVLNTEQPLLVQQTAPWVGTQPAWAGAGPLAGGQWMGAPAPALAPAVPISPAPAVIQAVPSCQPNGNGQQTQALGVKTERLTCEEWCQIMREMQGRAERLPMPQREQRKGKED